MLFDLYLTILCHCKTYVVGFQFCYVMTQTLKLDYFQLAVFNMTSLSVAYFLNDVSCSNSPIISIIWKEVANNSLAKSPKQPQAHAVENSTKEIMFVLTRDAKIIVLDGHSGNMITARTWNLKKESTAVSLFVIGK